MLRPKTQYLGGVPAVAWAVVTKDKQQFAFQGEAEGSWHPRTWLATTAGCNVQTIGRDVLYTPKMEARMRMFGKRSKATLGCLMSTLGEDYSHPFKNTGAYAYGIKVDERVRLTPNAKLRCSVGRVYTKAGAMRDNGTALAGDLRLRPGGDDSVRVLLGGTAVFQRRDHTLGGNVSTEFRVPALGRGGGKSDTTCSMNAQYNNKGNGQLGLRISSHDYPQLAGAMILPIARALWAHLTAKEEHF